MADSAILSWASRYIERQVALLDRIDDGLVCEVVKILQRTNHGGGKIFIVGNGGSAANASHFATDLGKGASATMLRAGFRPFKVISLTDNVPWITAIGNDISFDNVFSDQLNRLADMNDVLIGISVSGTSPNLLRAFDAAKDIGMVRVAMTGLVRSGKRSKQPVCIGHKANVWIELPEKHYGAVEDAEMMMLHMLAYFFMENLTEERRS